MSKYIVYAHSKAKEPGKERDGFAALTVRDGALRKSDIHAKIREAELAQSVRYYQGDLQAGSFNYVIVADAPDEMSALKQAQHQGLKWEPKKDCLIRQHKEARRPTSSPETEKPQAKPASNDNKEIDDVVEEFAQVANAIGRGFRRVGEELVKGFKGEFGDKPKGPGTGPG